MGRDEHSGVINFLRERDHGTASMKTAHWYSLFIFYGVSTFKNVEALGGLAAAN